MRKQFISLFLTYLRIAAKIQLDKIKPKHIIGITGSVGKSSCREAIHAVLKDKFRVKQSTTGNSETGLPLDILGFPAAHDYTFLYWLTVLLLTPWKLLTNWEKYDIYVAEMGVDSPIEPKNMSYLLKIIRPDIGVFLNVFPVHTEFFKTETSIANEKGKLITSLPRGGYAVLNSTDPKVFAFKSKTAAKIITFKGDIEAAALAVGRIFGLSGPLNYVLPPGRMSYLKGIKNTTIIDSSYNASRGSMILALKTLKNHPGKRKIAVLGDMRELGDLAEKEHKIVAAEALKDADYIFTFGPLMAKYFPQARNYHRMSDLISAVINFLKPGDVILVKGSQNTILLETLVEKLLANPQDIKKLCRRGEYWDKKRAALLQE